MYEYVYHISHTNTYGTRTCMNYMSHIIYEYMCDTHMYEHIRQISYIHTYVTHTCPLKADGFQILRMSSPKRCTSGLLLLA